MADIEFVSDATVIKWIRAKYIAILTDLDERGRRRWAAAEATSLGWGGISAVAQATGISDRTIRTGIRELEDPAPLPSTRRQGKIFVNDDNHTLSPGSIVYVKSEVVHYFHDVSEELVLLVFFSG